MRAIVVGVLAGVAVTFLANVATTIYLHRALSHRALTLRTPVAHVFRAIIWVATGIKPRQWVAVHRKHHAFTDVEGDPHSPALLGWRKVQRSNVLLYRAEARNEVTVSRYARDLPPDRWDRLLYDRLYLGLGIGVAVLMIAIGPWAGLVAAFVHLNFYIGASAAVNALGHHFGRRPYPNRAGNLQWLAFLTAGEGLHNNHHAAPTSAKLSHRWYEIDPGWWCIRTLAVLRLARLRLNGVVLK